MRCKWDLSQVGMEKYFQLEGTACANALHAESHREPREQGTGGHQGNALETPRLCLYSTDNGREWKSFREEHSREIRSKHCVFHIPDQRQPLVSYFITFTLLFPISLMITNSTYSIWLVGNEVKQLVCNSKMMLIT